MQTQQKPAKISQLDFKQNAFNARTFAGALTAARNYFKTVYNYTGDVKNEKLFNEGGKIVFRFYTPEHNAYFVF